MNKKVKETQDISLHYSLHTPLIVNHAANQSQWNNFENSYHTKNM